MWVRLCAFVVWGLVAATGVFWGLRVSARGPQAPAHAVPVGDASVTRGDLSRLLGTGPVPSVANAAAEPAEADMSSRFRLLGVMAPKRNATGPSKSGLALIAIDGKPAKAYAVGAAVDGDLVLQRVSLRSAAIGPAQGAAVILEMPPLAAAATGTLATPVGLPPAPPVMQRPAVRPGAGFPVPQVPVVNLPPPGLPMQPQIAPPPPQMPGASLPGGAVMQQRDVGAPTQ